VPGHPLGREGTFAAGGWRGRGNRFFLTGPSTNGEWKFRRSFGGKRKKKERGPKEKTRINSASEVSFF